VVYACTSAPQCVTKVAGKLSSGMAHSGFEV
jgi:hypothetical protein